MSTAVQVAQPAAGPSTGFADLQRRFYWYCLWPALGVLVVVTLLPTLYLIATSFTPLDLTQPATAWNFSMPLLNYELLLDDARFHNSLWVQVKLSFWTVGLQLLLGFLFALLLNIRSTLLEALRTLFLIPMVLPPIVVAIIWKVLYTPDISPFHWSMEAMGFDVPALITHPDYALLAIIIADTWEWFPFTMLMILAALQMMPEEYIDAAKIDGASVWQMTLYVTLPYLKGVLLVAGLFRLDRQHQGFPTDLHPDRRRAGHADRSHQLLLVHPGLQFLVPRLFERDHRDPGGDDRHLELGDHPRGRLGRAG